MKSSDDWSEAVVDGIEELSPTVRGLRLRPTGGLRPWSVGSHLRVQVVIGGGHEAGDEPVDGGAGGGEGDRDAVPNATANGAGARIASTAVPSGAAAAAAASTATTTNETTSKAAAGIAPHLRSYSLVGLPADGVRSGVYRIAVKRAGQSRGGSAFMWRLQSGDRIRIAGPDNHFELPARAPQTLLIAGGIGITPLLGMALTLAARGDALRMCYATRDAGELVFGAELAAALGDRLRTFCDDAGQRIDLDAEIAALPPRARLLICGPVPLLQAAQAAWQRAGRPAAELRFETFGSSGNLPVEPFWVRVPRHDLVLQVPAERTLLDVLDAHGVQTLWECKRGECGLCAVDILELHGTVDHRDVFFSAAEKRANAKLCACVSRVCGGGVVLDSAFRPDVAGA